VWVEAYIGFLPSEAWWVGELDGFPIQGGELTDKREMDFAAGHRTLCAAELVVYSGSVHQSRIDYRYEQRI
jgi:hypothetical protein